MAKYETMLVTSSALDEEASAACCWIVQSPFFVWHLLDVTNTD